MKKSILLAAILLSVVVVSCRKTRTCTCKGNTTEDYTTVPRNGGAVTYDKITSNDTQKFTADKITKKEMKRHLGCNSHTESSVDTYSTIVGFSGTSVIIGDVTVATKTEYTCEIE